MRLTLFRLTDKNKRLTHFIKQSILEGKKMLDNQPADEEEA